MDILETSINAAGGVGALAKELDVGQSVVSNWRTRGLPKPWRLALTLKYGKKTKKPAKPSATRSSGATKSEAIATNG